MLEHRSAVAPAAKAVVNLVQSAKSHGLHANRDNTRLGFAFVDLASMRKRIRTKPPKSSVLRTLRR